MPESLDDQSVDSCWSRSSGSAALDAPVSSDQCDEAERRRTGQQCATRVTAVSEKPISVLTKSQLENILLVSWKTLLAQVLGGFPVISAEVADDPPWLSKYISTPLEKSEQNSVMLAALGGCNVHYKEH